MIVLIFVGIFLASMAFFLLTQSSSSSSVTKDKAREFEMASPLQQGGGGGGRVSRENLRSSLALLSVPRDSDIQALFEQVDRDGDGTLTLKEVEKAILARKAQFDLPPAVVLRAFSKTDTDDDGKIGRDEFFQFIRCVTYYKKLMAVFESMDTNNDRHLDKKEFSEAAYVLGLDSPDDVFAEIDENNSGYIVFDEFCIWIAEKRNIDDVVAKESKKDS